MSQESDDPRVTHVFNLELVLKNAPPGTPPLATTEISVKVLPDKAEYAAMSGLLQSHIRAFLDEQVEVRASKKE